MTEAKTDLRRYLQAVLLVRAARQAEQRSYEGHCGLPDVHGGSRPKSECGLVDDHLPPMPPNSTVVVEKLEVYRLGYGYAPVSEEEMDRFLDRLGFDIDALKRLAAIEDSVAFMHLTKDGNGVRLRVQWSDRQEGVDDPEQIKRAVLFGSLGMKLREDKPDVLGVYVEGWGFTESVRNRGLGFQMMGNMFTALRERGYSYVSADAGMPVGTYAWAKAGFDYDTFEEEGVIGRRNTRFHEWAKTRGIPEPEGGWPEFKTPYQFATYRHPSGHTVSSRSILNSAVPSGQELQVGKAFMLDYDGHGPWGAIMYLQPEKQRSYEGHCGLPGVHGGSRPKSECGLEAAESSAPEDTTGGTCYQTAGRWIMDNGPEWNGIPVRLAHGTVVGQGRLEGVRYDHAWIEIGDSMVYDTEREKFYARPLYYAVGQVSNVTLYTHLEAIEWMLETEHFGPWEGGWVETKAKRSYEGHCGLPDVHGGSRPKEECGLLSSEDAASEEQSNERIRAFLKKLVLDQLKREAVSEGRDPPPEDSINITPEHLGYKDWSHSKEFGGLSDAGLQWALDFTTEEDDWFEKRKRRALLEKLLNCWRGSASNGPSALELQLSAADEFELEVRESLLERYADALWHYESTGQDVPNFTSKGIDAARQRAFLRKVYDRTQAALRGAGYKPGDTITLWRGTGRWVEGAEKTLSENQVVKLEGNPMSSWTLGRRMAEWFVSPGYTREGILYRANIPVESILSFAGQGLGTVSELEFVVLLDKKGHRGVVEKFVPAFPDESVERAVKDVVVVDVDEHEEDAEWLKPSRDLGGSDTVRSYEGHCGLPGVHGGSRPKEECALVGAPPLSGPNVTREQTERVAEFIWRQQHGEPEPAGAEAVFDVSFYPWARHTERTLGEWASAVLNEVRPARLVSEAQAAGIPLTKRDLEGLRWLAEIDPSIWHMDREIRLVDELPPVDLMKLSEWGISPHQIVPVDWRPIGQWDLVGAPGKSKWRITISKEADDARSVFWHEFAHTAPGIAEQTIGPIQKDELGGAYLDRFAEFMASGQWRKGIVKARSYEGHCGLPGVHGGSRPKEECALLDDDTFPTAAKGDDLGLEPSISPRNRRIHEWLDKKARERMPDFPHRFDELFRYHLNSEFEASMSDEGEESGWLNMHNFNNALLQASEEGVRELAQGIGWDAQDATSLVNEWSVTSTQSVLALRMQAAAEDVFGLEPREGLQERLKQLEDLAYASQIRLAEELASPDRARDVLLAMYDRTQAELREAGYMPGDTVTLWRGTKKDMDFVKSLAEGQVIKAEGNAMSSWSLSRPIAKAFAHYTLGLGGLLVRADVPVEAILSTAFTGYGAPDEFEVVVLLDKRGVQAVVERTDIPDQMTRSVAAKRADEPIIMDVDDTDENADWIKAAKLRVSQENGKEELATEDTLARTREWWRRVMPDRYKGILDATIKQKEV